jgi:hypothetical protein
VTWTGGAAEIDDADDKNVEWTTYVLTGTERDVALTQLVVDKVIQSRSKRVRIFLDVCCCCIAKPDRRRHSFGSRVELLLRHITTRLHIPLRLKSLAAERPHQSSLLQHGQTT